MFTTISLVLAYPFWMAFYVENVELAVWVVVALGIWLYVEDHNWASVACFGIAGSMKYFPLIYLGLALAKRQYKEVAFGLLVCATTMLVSLAILGPTILSAYKGLHAQVPDFTDYYIYKFHALESGTDHSLFSALKLVLYLAHHVTWSRYASRAYLVLVAAAGCSAYFLKIRSLPWINQVLTLSITAVLLPPVSSDYTLIHLYAGFFLLTLYALSHPQDKRLWVVFACFLLLFVPENYLIVWMPSLATGLRLGGQLKALVLVALFILGLHWPFQDETEKHHTRLTTL